MINSSVVRNAILQFVVVATLATTAAAYFLPRLYVELQISLHGEETDASVELVDTEDRDDGDRAWTVDLINYTFRTKDGLLFAGINEANSSETARLIGRPDSAGKYHAARVEYLLSDPRWHRLKGWGYNGLGPAGSVLGILGRMALVLVPVALAYWYAYEGLIEKLGSGATRRKPTPEGQRDAAPLS
jgi:hypothetical protein